MRASVGQYTAGLALVAGALFTSASVMAETVTPAEWLQRMSVAVESTDYEGTVVRIRGDEVETLKVAHSFVDGVVREKVVAQEGSGLEIIRNGNEVHCILPDSQSVLVEQWDDQATLFSTLPTSEIRFGSEYDVSIVREERIAGRKTVLIAIRPHDEYRYGHRIWLDKETGFPLQTRLIGEDGSAIEQVIFADITIGAEIQASSLSSSYSTDDFRWFSSPNRHTGRSIEAQWTSDQLPRGFKAISVHEERMSEGDQVVTHILYSDGLANVSVFIADQGKAEGPSHYGGSNSYSVHRDGRHITAVGEVPAATVEQIATTMRLR